VGQKAALDCEADRARKLCEAFPMWLDLTILWPRKTNHATRDLRHSAHVSIGSTRWSKTMTDVGRRDMKHCPRCGATMFLEQVMAKFGPLPETRRYRCPKCRRVVEEEIDRDRRPLSAIKFTGLADWLGTRRVVN
jgi:ribosomal protein S27AE